MVFEHAKILYHIARDNGPLMGPLKAIRYDIIQTVERNRFAKAAAVRILRIPAVRNTIAAASIYMTKVTEPEKKPVGEVFALREIDPFIEAMGFDQGLKPGDPKIMEELGKNIAGLQDRIEQGKRESVYSQSGNPNTHFINRIFSEDMQEGNYENKPITYDEIPDDFEMDIEDLAARERIFQHARAVFKGCDDDDYVADPLGPMDTLEFRDELDLFTNDLLDQSLRLVLYQKVDGKEITFRDVAKGNHTEWGHKDPMIYDKN